MTRSAPRIAGKLLDAKQDVRVFLVNDAVDTGRDACEPPEWRAEARIPPDDAPAAR